MTEQNKKTGKRQRFFDWETKEKCWNKSQTMIGRHPDRWRLDAMGNPVCKVNLQVF